MALAVWGGGSQSDDITTTTRFYSKAVNSYDLPVEAGLTPGQLLPLRPFPGSPPLPGTLAPSFCPWFLMGFRPSLSIELPSAVYILFVCLIPESLCELQ